MKKFNAEEALKGSPIKLRNGDKAYIKKCNEGAIYCFIGHVEGEEEIRLTWSIEGEEYIFTESQRDIVDMWSEDETFEEENIFEKALKEKLPLRYTILEDSISDFYCIAKTQDGDYILERNDTCAVYVTKLSLFVQSLEWYIVEAKLPKAFIPNEGEEFWFIHPTELKHKQKAKFVSGSMFYQDMVNVGLVFRTEEDAEQALRFLRNNIEVNHGEEQK